MPPLAPPTAFTPIPGMAVDAGDLIVDWRYTRGGAQTEDNVVTWTWSDPGWQILDQWHGLRTPTWGRSAQLSIRYYDSSTTLDTSATAVQSGTPVTTALLSIRTFQWGFHDVINWRAYTGEETAEVEQVTITGAPWSKDYAYARAAGMNLKANGTSLDSTFDHELDDTGVWTGGIATGGNVPDAFHAQAPTGATPIAVDPSPILGPYGRVNNPSPPPAQLVTAGPWFLWLLAMNGAPGGRRGLGLIHTGRR